MHRRGRRCWQQMIYETDESSEKCAPAHMNALLALGSPPVDSAESSSLSATADAATLPPG